MWTGQLSGKGVSAAVQQVNHIHAFQFENQNCNFQISFHSWKLHHLSVTKKNQFISEFTLSDIWVAGAGTSHTAALNAR